MLSVLQDWVFGLNLQQQSVVILALRGPDGVHKMHPCKPIIHWYRASILKSAPWGRPMLPGEGCRTDNFMNLDGFENDDSWFYRKRDFFRTIDELPHHAIQHLAHGAQIIGYKHPGLVFSRRWHDFYMACCNDAHMQPETEEQMDKRLADWKQVHWGDPEQAHLCGTLELRVDL